MNIIITFIAIVLPLVSGYNQFRIVGGVNADINSAPFIVSFLVKNRRSQFIPFCAGSVLSESWILTAAHCLVLEPYRINIAAGHYNQKEFEDTTQFRKADFYVQHENFERIGPYDIGLLHVSQPFKLTPQVQKVSLSKDDEYVGDATIYGWGSTLPSRRRQFPSNLQTANLTLVDNSFCSAIFPIEINNGNLCAGLPDIGKGGCVGDSGGPLMQNGSQIGITSWGPITCNPLEGPSVFTKVSYYIPWIKKQLELAKEIENEDGDDDEDDYHLEDDHSTDRFLDLTTTKANVEQNDIILNENITNFE